jgi:hypothetical protein
MFFKLGEPLLSYVSIHKYVVIRFLKDMTGNAFSMGEEIELRTVPYKLHKELWDRFNFPYVNIQFSKWQKIKYLNANADDFDKAIDNIPANKGGLYLFYVKCEIISGITEYPLYIGRAQLTVNQNLRKRVKEYFQHFSRDNERPKITRMFKYWAKDLHLAYLALNDNADIVELEKQIINCLLLPMNDEIPDKEIKQAVKAF